ncbi:MAG: DUF86 domain-containing protein [Anaerolineae bacterium]
MKKSPENDPVRIRHMLDAAQKIVKHTAGKSRVDLDTDEVLALAVVRLIEIVGEAATQVTDETRAQYPQIQWQDIADMRHRVIHGYFNIELDIVWNTVVGNIPPLIVALEAILRPPAS